MNEIMKLFESPAILLILGAVIGFIPTYILNRQNNKHLEMMFVREKKHETYINFMILNQKILSHNLAQLNGKDDLAKKLSTQILELNDIVKSEISIYTSKKINNIASEIFSTTNPTSEQEATIYNKKREKLFPQILDLMRQDLGIDG